MLLVLVLCFSCSLLFVFVSDGCRATERQVDRGVDTDPPPAGWNGSQGWGLTRSCSAPICILTKLISSSRVRKLVPETDQTTWREVMSCNFCLSCAGTGSHQIVVKETINQTVSVETGWAVVYQLTEVKIINQISVWERKLHLHHHQVCKRLDKILLNNRTGNPPPPYLS